MAAWTIGTGYVPPRKDVADAENGLEDPSWLKMR